MKYTEFPTFIILPKPLAFTVNGLVYTTHKVEDRFTAHAGIYKCSGGTAGSGDDYDSVEYSPINKKARSWNFKIKNYLKLKEEGYIIEFFTSDQETVTSLSKILKIG